MLSADVCHLSSLRCYCSASQQAWHRLTHGHLSYGAIQWPGCSCSADTSLCVSLFRLLFLMLLHPPPPPLHSLQWSYLSLISASLTLPPIVFLTHYHPLSHLHPFLSPSRCLSSLLRPSTSLSHTLAATLKTVVTMVTAMCCGNVKEPNPPRITSLFNT